MFCFYFSFLHLQCLQIFLLLRRDSVALDGLLDGLVVRLGSKVALLDVGKRPIAWQGRWRRTRLSILILLSQLTYKIELICIHGVLNEGCFGDPLCLTADPCQRHYRLRDLPTFRLFPSNFCRDTWILPHLCVRQVLGKALDEWLMHVFGHLR